MYLRKISALRSQLFPYIGNSINAHDINSFVRKIKEVIHHLIEYSRISVIQVPLVRIERGHYIMAAFLEPCKVPGRSRREDLGHSFLISGRNLIIVIEEIAAHILAVAFSGFLCPLMVLRSMIHDKIHADIDLPAMAGSRKIFQILHGPEMFLYLSEVTDSVTSVRTAFRSLKERHQMNIIDTALLQIGYFAFYALDIACKIIDIEHHSKKIIAFIPGGISFSGLIQLLQAAASLLIKLFHPAAEFRVHGTVVI